MSTTILLIDDSRFVQLTAARQGAEVRWIKRERSLHNCGRRMTSRVLIALWMLCSFSWGQLTAPGWQEQVRKCVQRQDWSSALHIVDHEIALTPQDMDVRAWRARVLMWSGQLADAEREYDAILRDAPQDPDNWMGLASVYLREERKKEAVTALDQAVELDPARADLHVTRGRALRDIGRVEEARLEFSRAFELDPQSAEARAGLFSLRSEPKHELRFGVDTDLFSFADVNEDAGISLKSHWTPRWTTNVLGSFYQRAAVDAEKLNASVGGTSLKWGTLTAGGAAAHDQGVIPKSEAFFDYDRGWKTHSSHFFRGLELDYGQHWYWYRTARVFTLNETTRMYLPREWTWSLGVTGARSHFPDAGTGWRPSGFTKINFPITGGEQRHLGGNLFYAVGTENFAQVDQIGSFSSHTYGGGLRLQLTPRQDLSGFGAYQQRTQDRSQTSFGISYGIRF